MGKALMIATEQPFTGVNATESTLFGGALTTTTELNVQVSCSEAATFSNLRTNCISGNSGTATYRFRDAGANGQQVIAFTGTGIFEDTTNTDALTAGDLFNIGLTDTGTDQGLSWFAANIELASGHGNIHGASRPGAVVIDPPSTTRYIALGGNMDADANATEAPVAWKVRGYDIFEAFQFRLLANARTTDTVFRNGIQGANGTGVVTVPGGVAGLFEDTGIGDAIADGDTINLRVTFGTGTQDITVVMYAATLKSSAGHSESWIQAPQAGLARAASATEHYCPIGGLLRSLTAFTEAQAACKPGFAGTASDLRCNLSANTYSADGTLKLYKNGSAVITLTLTAGGGAAWYENTSDTVAFDADDVFSLAFDEGTSGSITIQSAGLTFRAEAAGTTVSVPARAHTYTANAPKVSARVQPAQATHSYTGQVPKFLHTVRPAQTTHNYTAQAPQLRARVQPGQAAHSYVIQAPQLRVRVQPAPTTHTYTGRVPGITAISGVNAPAAAHSYTGQAPQVRSRVQAGQATHAYSGQVPVLIGTLKPGQATHSYVMRTPQVRASVGPAPATHSYTAQAPQAREQVKVASAVHGYSVPAPKVQARVDPGTATHAYTARVPKLQVRVEPGAAMHTYTAHQVTVVVGLPSSAGPGNTLLAEARVRLIIGDKRRAMFGPARTRSH